MCLGRSPSVIMMQQPKGASEKWASRESGCGQDPTTASAAAKFVESGPLSCSSPPFGSCSNDSQRCSTSSSNSSSHYAWLSQLSSNNGQSDLYLHHRAAAASEAGDSGVYSTPKRQIFKTSLSALSPHADDPIMKQQPFQSRLAHQAAAFTTPLSDPCPIPRVPTTTSSGPFCLKDGPRRPPSDAAAEAVARGGASLNADRQASGSISCGLERQGVRRSLASDLTRVDVAHEARGEVGRERGVGGGARTSTPPGGGYSSKAAATTAQRVRRVMAERAAAAAAAASVPTPGGSPPRQGERQEGKERLPSERATQAPSDAKQTASGEQQSPGDQAGALLQSAREQQRSLMDMVDRMGDTWRSRAFAAEGELGEARAQLQERERDAKWQAAAARESRRVAQEAVESAAEARRREEEARGAVDAVRQRAEGAEAAASDAEQKIRDLEREARDQTSQILTARQVAGEAEAREAAAKAERAEERDSWIAEAKAQQAAASEALDSARSEAALLAALLEAEREVSEDRAAQVDSQRREVEGRRAEAELWKRRVSDPPSSSLKGSFIT